MKPLKWSLISFFLVQPSWGQTVIFEKINGDFVKNKCAICHFVPTGSGDVDFSSYEAIMKSEKTLVVLGQPEESLFYKIVKDDDMPLVEEPLTERNKKDLYDWILQGAVP